jgi:hypothetical protein
MEEIRVKIKGGYIRAVPSGDPDYPGIWVEIIKDDEPEEVVSRPQVLVEQAFGDTLRALVWNDSTQEDYTDEIIFEK